MTDIGKTKLQGRPFTPTQGKVAKGQTGKEKQAQGAQKAAEANVALALKAKMVEFLLVVKNEAKDGFETQAGLVEQRAAGNGFDYSSLQYNGTPLSELTPEDARALIAEDGYFGVAKTAQRLADFVVNGAGENLAKLQAGRDGIQKGFQEAEELWGGKLPEISYQTLDKALEMIDARIKELGGALVDVQA